MKRFKFAKSCITLFLVMAMALSGMSFDWNVSNVKADDNTPYLLSKNRQTYASSENGTGEPAIYATDGKMTTKWQAARGVSNQWITVDLGASANISQVIIRWQGANDYASDLDVMVSDDEIHWTSLYRDRANDGGETIKVPKAEDPTKTDYTYLCQDLTVSGKGRYVKIFGRKGASSYGIAIRELEIYGTGGLNRREVERNNLSLGKEATASSYVEAWNKNRTANYAFDNCETEYWTSESNNDEWIQVDLGAKYKIGKVELQWNDKYGRLFEIQTSLDGKTWNVLYRETAGCGEDCVFNCYKDARYVRMQGVAMRDNGYSIKIFNVYEYVEGETKNNPTFGNFNERSVVNVGKGSYLIDDKLYQPREPKYVTKNVKVPIPSNDWWTSILYKRYSDTLVALPLCYSYSSAGLSMYCADKTYITSNSGSQSAQSKFKDITIGTSAILETPSARLDAFGDFSTTIQFSDDNTPKMRSTLIKGSQFIYNTFADPNSADITVCNLDRLFDDDGNEILKKDGDSIVTDHIGIQDTNQSKSEESGDKTDQIHYYGVFAPANTTFIRSGDKIKVRIGNGENYLNVGVMTKEDDLSYMYNYAYSFVTDTKVSYKYDESKSSISTTFSYVTEMKRTEANFKNEVLTCLYPHQYKSYKGSYTGRTFDSLRGTLKQVACKKFTYTKRFGGIVPNFNEPTESKYYDRQKLNDYIDIVKKSANFTSYWTADPYWQGKKTHKLTMIALIAQELEDYELRDKALNTLKKILVNWLTYDGEDDVPFYMYYHTNWGSMSGDGGDHGMAKNLTDHHFLWAYYIFPAAVLASYDSQFLQDYGDMVEMLIRDCMNPDKKDEMFPFMRNFDPYEGHSWAGGYGDNSSGNNQESSSEGTFAWAGLYLWGLVTNKDKYRDAGIWGYTTEVSAIEQYWFDYDDDVWDEDYTHGAVGMVWGTAYTYGTYFGTKPSYIYGIQMLPVTPALCYFGEKPDKAKKVWEEFCEDQDRYEDSLTEMEGNVFGWYHIMWPFWSQSDPDAANAEWAKQESKVQISDDERFNSYWFMQNMSAKGTPSLDVWSSNYTSYQVFKKGDKYNATVWNPYDYEIKVEFSDKTGQVGSVRLAPNTTVTVDPYKVSDLTSTDIPELEDTDSTYQVPGKIEAENYYTNFNCSKQTNNQIGEYVGYIDNGDYTVYQIDVAEEADYVVEYNVKFGAEKDNQSISLKSSNDPERVISTTTITKGTDWYNVEGKVHLARGKQNLKLVYNGGGYHLNYFRIYKEGEKPSDPSAEDLVRADLSGATLVTGVVSATDSSHKGTSDASKTLDGNYTNTRWESEYSDPQWMQLEYNQPKKIGGLKIYWQNAASKNYEIQISDDGENWTTVFTRTNGDGGKNYGDDKVTKGLESIKLSSIVTAKYIRLYSTARTSGYGNSIFEFEVYGPATDQKEALDAPSPAASITGADHDAVTVNWNSVNHAASYDVYRSKNDGDKEKIASVATTNYTDKDLPNGRYTYYVVAQPSNNTYQESNISQPSNSLEISNDFKVTSVTLNKTNINLNAGDMYKLEASVLPAKATDQTITWTSDNRDVATVTKGVVRGVSNGTAVITATAKSGVKATCKVTVVGSIYDHETETEEAEETTKKQVVPTTKKIVETTTQQVIVPTVPTNLKIKVAANKATISFDKVNNASAYSVYKANTRFGTYNKIATINDNQYTDNGNGYYKVTATVNNKESDKSEAISEDIQLFGPNVYVFDPNDKQGEVQSVIYDTYDKQESNQFGDDRYALMFKPGTYDVNVDVGFYTEVLGLGLNPTDTTLKGLRCGAWWMPMTNGHVGFNATCNFWRGAANMQVNDNVTWAVSQSVSMRRMQINGNLALHHLGGWSSGGFLADCNITGSTESGSQQQWFSRNDNWNLWKGENWNMVFAGIAQGKVPKGDWPEHAYTSVNETPIVREKPFLVYTDGSYKVFVPGLMKDAQGVSWVENQTPGTLMNLDKFYVAKASVDNAQTLNQALSEGNNIILTPGIYNIDESLKVTRKDTIILGLGLATLNVTNGNNGIDVSDVDNVSISGILLDAGSKQSEALLKIGDAKSNANHADNPITISDVYFRVGGSHLGRATTSLLINSNDVIGDNLWVWRADHGSGVAWDKNTAKNGMVVNGDRVTMYALMVEHYQEYQTLWNGEYGRTYFYQSEIPYDVPEQSKFKSPNGKNGFASYKVGDDVKNHEAWGLGVYSFNRDAKVEIYNAVEVPELSTVTIHNACSVMLAGSPGITHVVNDCGRAVTYSGDRATVGDYSGNVLQPVIEPSSGNYNEAKTITITSRTEGAKIYYTLDGSEPSKENGTLYTAPFKLETGYTKIKAIAVKDGKTDSYVTEEEITIGNILLGKTATSSTNQGNDTAAKAIDGLPNTRWQSVFKEDPQWLMVDMGKEYNLESFSLTWQNAAAKVYSIQASKDGNNWDDIYTENNGKAGAVLTAIPINYDKTARYIRIFGTERTQSNYGYSIYEFAVYGDPADGKVECDPPTNVKTTDFGEGTISIAWDSVGAATGYNIYRAKGTGVFKKINEEPIKDLKYTDVNLGFYDYSYKITAVNELGESDKSNSFAYADLSVYKPIETTVEHTTEPETEEETTTSKSTTKPIETTSIQDGGMTQPQTEVDQTTHETSTDDIVRPTQTIAPTRSGEVNTVSKPSKVKKLKVKRKSAKKIIVRWKANKPSEKVSYYQIRYGLKKKLKKYKTKNVKVKNLNKTKYKVIIKKLKSKKYFVKIRAVKVVLGQKYYGKWTKVKTVRKK